MPEFLAEVIAIGDEMTSGAKLDTNTQWICQRLEELGVTVRHTSMVGDNMAANVNVFRHAATRVDFVVATGGLGPTADDLTRECLAIVADRPLVLHQPSLAHIESLFAGRDREMPPRNRVQAMFPEGALDIFNPRGTAPGIDVSVSRVNNRHCRMFALPGVPAEMKEMFTQIVAPRIAEQMAGDRPLIRTAIIKCFGVGESEMEAKLGEMISRKSSPRVGITVSGATISLRITATGASESQCAQAIQSVRQEIDEKAGEFVFGEGEEYELQHAVADFLHQRGERIASVEVGHAAPIANWFADVAPSGIYAGGAVTSHSPNDLQTIRQQMDADWVIVVDKYPSLRTLENELPEIRLSVIGKSEKLSITKNVRLGGHPSIVHARIGKAALALTRSHLLTHFSSPSTTHASSTHASTTHATKTP